MHEYWIWLASRPSVTDRARASLLERFGDPEKLYLADGKTLDAVPGLSSRARASLLDKDLSQAQSILADCRREGVGILTCQDSAYPRRLRNIPDPPTVLYYKGHVPEMDDRPVIGVVGTRAASAYGMTAAQRLGYQIVRCGGVVVSGGASGIDTMAMTGAMLAGQGVVGVLGCGLDVAYPKSNQALFADVQAYGCLMSEYPPGTPPMGRNFPRRNRIISGLSTGVVVVEAPEKSGAMITARLAADQGRDVFAVPGNIDQPTCQGSNHLLGDGAIVASSGWDILREYQAVYPDKLHREDGLPPDWETSAQAQTPHPMVAQEARVPAQSGNLKKIFNNKTIDKPGREAYSDVQEPLRPRDVTAQEQMILDAMGTGERLVDDVIAETGLTTGQVLAGMTILELKGYLRRLPGKRIAPGKRIKK